MRSRELRPAWAEIDLDIFEHNIKEVRRVIGPRPGIMAVVKANAYGHGAVECALVAQETGCSLAVAIVSEGVELRKAGLKGPVLVLGYTPPEQAGIAVENDLDVTIFGMEAARALSAAAARHGKWARAHVKVETGMGRIGLVPGPALTAFIAQAVALPNLKVAGIFTHFAAADSDSTYTQAQFKAFRDSLRAIERLTGKGILKHSSNSAAIMDFPETHLDAVRPGIILYGYYPSKTVARKAAVIPPLSLKCRIGHVRAAETGETIGYGRAYRVDKPCLIATLPVGYADGYRRAFSNKGHVLVRGIRAPIVGRVCMDQMMVDVTGIAGVSKGDEVVLLGSQGQQTISADDLAFEVATISHEVLTGIGQRVPRVYRRHGQWYVRDEDTGAKTPVEMG
ncbi:MAG: alanine racemase [Bacillota bacterium]|nr:alanine racemase [Bacillota bacterium]